MPISNPSLLVLAAGMGSRYGGLKQLDPVGPNAETIMDYSIFDAVQAGFERVVFVIRREMAETFRSTIGARFEKRVAVDYVFQEVGNLMPGFPAPEGRTKPWGTAHAVLMAAGVIEEPFAVINADDFYGTESFWALSKHLKSGSSEDAMVGFVLGNTLSEFGAVARGVCQVTQNGYLEQITELKSIERDGSRITNIDEDGGKVFLNDHETVSMNMWGFTPQIFSQLGAEFRSFLLLHGRDLKAESYIPNVINSLIHQRKTRVKVLHTSARWFGVTYREDHVNVVRNIAKLIEEGAYPERLWQ